MKQVFQKPACLTEEPFTYCPGCSHGVAHRLVAEVVDEMGLKGKIVGVSTIGCSVRCWRNFDFDIVQGAHGRGMAVATGIKRALPDSVVFTYQGDGDLAAIGMGETVHAAARGEAITVVFLNNSVFGATGGQLAPTTVPGQKTSTYPDGRDTSWTGSPIGMAELLTGLQSTTYVARGALTTAKNILKAKKYMRKAFEAQIIHGGFGLVELLGACPVNLKLSPAKALQWVEEYMFPYFPLGELKDQEGGSYEKRV